MTDYDRIMQKVTHAVILRHLKLQAEGRAAMAAVLAHANRRLSQNARRARERIMQSCAEFGA